MERESEGEKVEVKKIFLSSVCFEKSVKGRAKIFLLVWFLFFFSVESHAVCLEREYRVR